MRLHVGGEALDVRGGEVGEAQAGTGRHVLREVRRRRPEFSGQGADDHPLVAFLLCHLRLLLPFRCGRRLLHVIFHADDHPAERGGEVADLVLVPDLDRRLLHIAHAHPVGEVAEPPDRAGDRGGDQEGDGRRRPHRGEGEEQDRVLRRHRGRLLGDGGLCGGEPLLDSRLCLAGRRRELVEVDGGADPEVDVVGGRGAGDDEIAVAVPHAPAPVGPGEGARGVDVAPPALEEFVVGRVRLFSLVEVDADVAGVFVEGDHQGVGVHRHRGPGAADRLDDDRLEGGVGLEVGQGEIGVVGEVDLHLAGDVGRLCPDQFGAQGGEGPGALVDGERPDRFGLGGDPGAEPVGVLEGGAAQDAERDEGDGEHDGDEPGPDREPHRLTLPYPGCSAMGLLYGAGPPGDGRGICIRPDSM